MSVNHSDFYSTDTPVQSWVLRSLPLLVLAFISLDIYARTTKAISNLDLAILIGGSGLFCLAVLAAAGLDREFLSKYPSIESHPNSIAVGLLIVGTLGGLLVGIFSALSKRPLDLTSYQFNARCAVDGFLILFAVIPFAVALIDARIRSVHDRSIQERLDELTNCQHISHNKRSTNESQCEVEAKTLISCPFILMVFVIAVITCLVHERDCSKSQR